MKSTQGWEALIIFDEMKQMMDFAISVSAMLHEVKHEVLPGVHSTGLLIRSNSSHIPILGRSIYEKAIKAGAVSIDIKWRRES